MRAPYQVAHLSTVNRRNGQASDQSWNVCTFGWSNSTQKYYHDVEKDGMRIACNGGCPDNMKCGTVVYNHRNKLKEVDQDERTIHIVTLEAESTLNHFIRKSNMPPYSQCTLESSCSSEGAIAYCCGK
jgi:hypothetical protein